jgi:hypothetical protein
MKRIGLVIGLVVVAFACSEQVGQMLTDGGQMMMDAGDAMIPDAGAQTLVQCNQTLTKTGEGGSRIEYRYAIATVSNPRTAQVELCYPPGHIAYLPDEARCIRSAGWYAPGGSTIHMYCGSKSYDAEGALVAEQPNPASITVYE